jgi:uncharacterized repeat protein (TIGR01451 family)
LKKLLLGLGGLGIVLLLPALGACGEPPAKLKVSQSIPDKVGPGDSVAAAITITNLGPGTVRGLRVQDRLPAGFQYQVTTTVGGSHSRTARVEPKTGESQPVWGTWTMVPPSDRANPLVISFKIRASEVPGNFTNAVVVTASSDTTLELDPNAKVTVIPRPAISVTVSTGIPEVGLGVNAVYTITVANTGSAEAPGITVIDILPPGLEFAGTQTIDGNAGRSSSVDPPAKSLMPAWAAWTIPAATKDGPGLLRIVFEARVIPGSTPGTFTDTVHVYNDRGLRVTVAEVAPVALK